NLQYYIKAFHEGRFSLMLLNNQVSNIRVKCVFQQGTPLREYVIIQSENGRIAIYRISEPVFDFFVRAKVPVCEPVTVPPGNLTGQNLLCVFKADLGAEETIPFVVTEGETDETVSIIQLTDEAYDFLRTIGIPVCFLSNEN
ncbi:MAG: hypothetical protein ACM3YE_09090, partial [Bacteroidota bacterium]